MRGLHKKQGRFSCAVDHLVETQCVEEDRDGVDDGVSETSCDKIDMSGIDFGNKKNKLSGDNRSSEHDAGDSLLGCNNTTTKSSFV